MKQKLLLISLMVLCVCFGFSQEKGKVGFFFKAGSSSDIGLTFNLSDRLTLRPSFGFDTLKIEEESVVGTMEKSTSYSLDLGLFYHFLKKNQFTAYSGLEMGYSHQKLERDVLIPGTYVNQDSTLNGYRGNLLLGLQYNFNKHLAVFGEVGFGFIEQNVDWPESKITGWNLTRSGFGIILYL